MSSGFLLTDPRLRELSDLGVIQAGAKLNTYVAGTPSTPLQTFSDIALTVPNTNPVVASAGGLLGPVYCTPGVSYKFVLTDSLGNLLWQQDNVPTPGGVTTVPNGGTGVSTLAAHGVLVGEGAAAIAATAAGTAGQVLTSNGAAADPTFQALPVDNGINDFRLSLSTTVPVTTGDVTAATSVRSIPYKGNRIALFDAAGVASVVTSAEINVALPAVANQVYDVFGFSNAGVFALELLAWTNDTTRATALTLATTGVYTKTGDLTRRYLGTCRTTAVAGQSEDSFAKRFLWNYYHRVPRTLKVFEATDSWTYNTATYRQARATATNQVEYVIGVAEVELELQVIAMSSNSAAADNTFISIAEGSVTGIVPDASVLGQTLVSQAAATILTPGRAVLRKYPPVGYRIAVWLEQGSGANVTTWYGDNGAATKYQSGLIGQVGG